MDEKWIDIKGYEGKYQISNLGNVRSLDREDRFGRRIKGMQISQQVQKNGYMFVKLRSDGTQKTFRVHRLVAEAFCNNPNNFPEVNHLDEDKRNNRADNLEWCTRSYNNSYGSGLSERKTKCSHQCVQMKDGEIIARFPSLIEASRRTGIPFSNIQRCVCGRQKSSRGFEWVRV